MSDRTLLLPSRYGREQGDISSEFDTPYSPTQNHPYPRGRYVMKGSTIASPSLKLFSRYGGPLINALPRLLWDRVVLACFCGCFVLFSYSLAGLGYAGHDYAACNYLSEHPYAIAKPLPDVIATATAASEITKDEEDERLDGRIDPSLLLNVHFPGHVAIATSTSTPAVHDTHGIHELLPAIRLSSPYVAGHDNHLLDTHDHKDIEYPAVLKIQDASLHAANHGRNPRKCGRSRHC